jgi:hypothetical protein
MLQQSRADRLYDLANGFSIVVSWQADNDIHLADIDQLAKEIVRKYASVRQRVTLRI